MGFAVGSCDAMRAISWDLRWRFAVDSRVLQQTWDLRCNLQHRFLCVGRICRLECAKLHHLRGKLQQIHSQKSTTLFFNNFRFNILMTRVVSTLIIN